MNIDIKSVLIGILLTTSIMLVMGFDDHKKEIGRYQGIHMQDTYEIYILDTTNGEFVKKFLRKDIKGL
jgi:hypothetical protein